VTVAQRLMGGDCRVYNMLASVLGDCDSEVVYEFVVSIVPC
jgi:hypothetical protein